MKYSVVIPAYNEKSTIRKIVQATLKYSRDIVVVDDGSIDGTAQELQDLPITLLIHSENKGKAASLWNGISTAISNGASAIITMDGDGQHSPDDIPSLLNAAENQPDNIIIGARLADKKAIPAKRYYANKFANFWISWAAGYIIEDSQSGFRLYPAKLFDDLSIKITKSKSFVFESEIIIKAAHLGIYSHSVTIPAVYSANARPSHFRGFRDITLITRMVAAELLKRGLYLPGLYRAWIKPVLPVSHYNQTGLDGYFILLLSVLLIALSAGTTYLLTYIYIFLYALTVSECNVNNSLLLVLGRKLINNLPDKYYLQRLDCAKLLLLSTHSSTALILGGRTGQSVISESSAGKNYLVSNGINPERIMIEESSRNTLENFQQTKILMPNHKTPIVLISNRYHLARTRIIAKGFAINSTVFPAERKLSPLFPNIIKILSEAFHLHWYLVGRSFARLTKNQKMLARIS